VSVIHRVRTQRLLREAEGYLELHLPQIALEVLSRASDLGTFRGQYLYLVGQALRELERYADAIVPLEEAADAHPSNIHVWLALGWCYKRLDRLDKAIEALQRARDVDPGQAVILYNLACYHSLASNKEAALEYLGRAIALDRDFLDLVGSESDFDPLRGDPDFRSLTSLIV
jgi:tetratricopeptide (TPR) repeat protein